MPQLLGHDTFFIMIGYTAWYVDKTSTSDVSINGWQLYDILNSNRTDQIW